MKKKNLLLVALLLIGMLVIAACGSNNSENNNGNADGGLPEGYPDQTLDMLVGYGAGGGSDLLARTAVQALTEGGIVEQDFVVENITGAGGGLALQELADRKGDPYSLIAVPEYGSPLWNGNAGGAGIEDFTPIAQVAADFMMILVRDDSPYETIEDLLEAMKEDAGDVVITMASSLDGGEPWRWIQIAEEYGIEGQLGLVSTDGGATSIRDLLGGHSDAAMGYMGVAGEHIESGDLRPLAILTKERVDAFPDTPTLVEIGVDVEYIRARGFWLAGDVSDEVIAYWENAFDEMMDTDVWAEYLENNGLLEDFRGRDEYKNYVEGDGAAYQEYFDSLQ